MPSACKESELKGKRLMRLLADAALD